MPWSPDITLLNTVREFQNFSHAIQYYDEIITPGGVDPATGLAGEDIITRIYYPVKITQNNQKPTITTTDGDTATISGFFRYIFWDTIQYRNFNDQLITLTGTETKGAWEQFYEQINDVYQLSYFDPDGSRDRTFSFTATAYNGLIVKSTQTYTIRVYDPSWTSGRNNLVSAVANIRAAGR